MCDIDLTIVLHSTDDCVMLHVCEFTCPQQELMEQHSAVLGEQEALLQAEAEQQQQLLRQKMERDHEAGMAALAHKHHKEQEVCATDVPGYVRDCVK